MSFPTSPVNGQTTSVNGILYVYNSVSNSWTRQLTQTGQKTTTSSTPPSNPGPGDTWYNSSNDTILTYMYDGLNWWWVDRDGPTFGSTSTNNIFGNLYVSGNIIPTANVTYSLGTTTQRFSSLYLSGNTIDLGGAVMKTDATTGAIALIPTPTASNPNPTGIVVAPTGAISTVTTTGGNLTANSISNVSNSIVATGSVIGNLVASGNAVMQNINLAGGNNLTLQSANLAAPQWGTSNVTVTSGQSDPFGGATAALLNDGTATNLHFIFQAITESVSTYTYSIYAKAGTSNYIGIYDSNQTKGVIFNLTTGAFSSFIVLAPTSYSIVSVGNGWYRCSMTVNDSAGSDNFNIFMSENGTSFNYTGTSQTVYVAAPQLELGTIASPYTPTTSSTVTTYNNINIPYGNLAVSGNINLASTGNNNSLVLQSQSNVDISANSVVLSNGTGVTAITRTAGGANYSSATTPVITAPTTAGGVQATATANMGMNGNPTVTAGGTGYTLNDILTVSGGTYTGQAQLQVTGISGGVITAVTVVNNVGSYTVVPTSPFSVTGGTGSAATFTLTNWSVQSLNITNAGSGYVEQPTVSFSGGGGSGAAAYATVGSGTVVKSIGSTMSLYTPAGEGFRVETPSTNTTDYVLVSGSNTGRPFIRSASASGSIDLAISSQGTGSLKFFTNYVGQEQFRVTHTASAVNFAQATGAATGGSPTISAQGSDSNIHLSLNGKGTGGVRTQFYHTVGYNYNNNLTLSGNVPGGAPSIVVYGTDTNVSMTLVTQGTGNITTANPVVITNANVSVSASTGALQVAGGAGIAGNVNIGGITVHTGNVGIATSTPARPLEVYNSAQAPSLRLSNSGGNQGIELVSNGGYVNWLLGSQYHTGNAFEITPSSAINNTTYTTPVVTVLASGAVGINTTSPGQALTVNGAANFQGIVNSYSGSLSIPSTGTYYIPNSWGFKSAMLSCWMDEIGNGVWQSTAIVNQGGAGNRRPFVGSIQKWQYSGNQISADLQPDQGSNTYAYISGGNANLAQVVVGGLGSGTTLHWNLLILA